MAIIEFRYRDYKDPRKRGTWMLVNGRQYQRISHRHLTNDEMISVRKNFIQRQKELILQESGFQKKSNNTFRDQWDNNKIVEVKLGDLTDEITDIEKDPATNQWKKEKSADRIYVDSDNIDELENHIS